MSSVCRPKETIETSHHSQSIRHKGNNMPLINQVSRHIMPLVIQNNLIDIVHTDGRHKNIQNK